MGLEFGTAKRVVETVGKGRRPECAGVPRYRDGVASVCFRACPGKRLCHPKHPLEPRCRWKTVTWGGCWKAPRRWLKLRQTPSRPLRCGRGIIRRHGTELKLSELCALCSMQRERDRKLGELDSRYRTTSGDESTSRRVLFVRKHLIRTSHQLSADGGRTPLQSCEGRH